ncbi:MAG: DUF3822 family protein [Muribaculaceae bacterium]|nr:DUF3822 family protein [Muribaculaceae bacterium]
MSHLSTDTSDISIKRPDLWTLLLAVERERIQFILYTPAQSNSLISREIPLSAGESSWTSALEDAVYEHPVLLDDYGSVAVVVNAPHFVVLPSSVMDDEELAEQAFAASFPDDDGDVLTCKLPQCEVGVAYSLPAGMQGFLQRTFNNAPIYHHLYPLCEHFKGLNAGSGISRMFINLHSNGMDMVVYRKGEMMLANSFPVRNANDAAFLALHTWQSFEMDALSDEIQLTGDKRLRDELAPRLREYVRYVMPAIYPVAAMRLGDNAMKAPFDLILLATCVS